MFRYLVTVEEPGCRFQYVISRNVALNKQTFRTQLRSIGRKFPDATSADISPIEESEYQRDWKFGTIIADRTPRGGRS